MLNLETGPAPGADEPSSGCDIYVARQPIYDTQLQVVGYEVLFRGTSENRATIIDGNVATSNLLLNAVFAQAIMLLGVDEVRTMAMLVSLSGVATNPGDLRKDSLHRAMMCERLAKLLGLADAASCFTAGLLSSLDAVLGLPLEEILATLPLAETLRQAVLHRTGVAGEILRSVVAIERADWDAVPTAGLSASQICGAYIESLEEVSTLWAAIHASE